MGARVVFQGGEMTVDLQGILDIVQRLCGLGESRAGTASHVGHHRLRHGALMDVYDLAS